MRGVRDEGVTMMVALNRLGGDTAKALSCGFLGREWVTKDLTKSEVQQSG